MATMNPFGLLNKKPASKKESYLSPSKVLSEEEYNRYKEAKVQESKRRYLGTSKRLQEKNKYLSGQESFARTRTGKVSAKTTSFFNQARQPKPVTNFLYNRNKPKSMSNTNFTTGNSYGKRGRPKGTLDPRYAQYGGVYGFRKAQAFERKKALLELKQRTNISPAQQRVIQQLQVRDQIQRENPERRTIPDTYGYSGQKSYHKEIDDYANLFP